MPEDLLGLLILPFVELNCRILSNGALQIIHCTVHCSGKNVCRKPGTDGLGDVIGAYAAFVLSHAAVRKCYLYHILLVDILIQASKDIHFFLIVDKLLFRMPPYLVIL